VKSKTFASFPKLSEADFLRQVIALARLNGWRVAHFRPAMSKSGRWMTAVQGDGAGFPDLVLVREVVIFAELKVGKNKPSPAQVAWLEDLKAAGAIAHVWRPEDWETIRIALSR
jgi:hypothetical protein